MTKFKPWKKSYRKIPGAISTSLSAIESPRIIVAATKKIPLQDIDAGCYAHLGLHLKDRELKIENEVMPPDEVGDYAYRNRHGWEIKRTDLPKIQKTFSWETPNFGDASTYGTHTHYQTRDVYPIEIFEPRFFSLKIERLNAETATALVKFEVDHVLDRSSPYFESDLLFCLNLLQESAGVANVFAADATREEFVGTEFLDWEVFPPGNAAAVLERFSSGKARMSPDKAAVLKSRLKLFSKLPVERFIRGTSSFGSYIGALYADDLVVFENMNYGNALYVLYDDWQEVSKRSRLDLLNGTSENFDRFVHTNGWETRFEEHIRRQLRMRERTKEKTLFPSAPILRKPPLPASR